MSPPPAGRAAENLGSRIAGARLRRDKKGWAIALASRMRCGGGRCVLGSTDPAQRIREKSDECFVGLDVSVKTTSVCVMDAGGSIIREGKTEEFAGGDRRVPISV